MRRKIFRISEDRFDFNKPEISLLENEIYEETYEKEPFSSSFEVSNIKNEEFSCNIYSSNPYIILNENSFEGASFTVNYHILNDGFNAGDTLSGEFLILYNGGEKHIPVTISYISKKFMVGENEINTPEDFRDYAILHPKDAVRLFHSDEFMDFARKQSSDFYLLFLSYKKALPTEVNLDEFLIGAGLKKRASYDIKKDYFVFDDIKEDTRQLIVLTKEGTGCLDIRVSCDNDFVTLGKDRITDAFFVGSLMQFDFYLHPKKMHAGKNLCKITFSSILGEKEVVVVVNRPSNLSKDDFKRIKKRSLVQLTTKYILFRQKELTVGAWSDDTVEILDRLIDHDSKEKNFFMLMKAQALIVNKRRQEALNIISALKREIEDKKSVEWAYLLYLCTLIEREKSYVDKLTREIEFIFREHPEDPRLFFFLLFLREDYVGNDLKKLIDIKQFMISGVYSPFFFVEVSDIYVRDPLLLKHFDYFSIEVLLWMIRHKAVQGNLAIRISSLLREEKSFDKRVFRIVTETYRLYPSDELLDGIVMYLLNNSIYGKVSLPWYSLSINLGKKYTGLYEAYILSLPDEYADRLPESVVRYFSYESSLEDRKKAFVYANVVLFKNDNPNLYREMSKSIQSFALYELRLGKMDDNLSILYQEILDSGIIDEDVALSISRILMPLKIMVFSSNIRSIIIYGDVFNDPKILEVHDHVAYTGVISNHYRIALLDNFGNLISDRTQYMIEPFIDISKVYDRLKELSKGNFSFFLHDLDSFKTADDFPEKADGLISDFLSSKSIARPFKMKNYGRIISYLKDNMKEDIFEDYLLSEADIDSLDTYTISYIIELYIIGGDYDRALDLSMNYFADKVSGKSLLKLCVNEVEKEHDKIAHNFLIMLSIYLMSEYLTDPVVTNFLNENYSGPTEAMVMLWKHADAISLNVTKIEEKILTAMLYTEIFLPEHELIFESYLMKANRNKMLIEAYLTYFAHFYLKGEKEVSKEIFKHIEEYYDSGENMNEGMKLALLKNLSLKEDSTLSKKELKMMDEFLSNSIRKNLYFDFYRHIYSPYRVKYHLYDKYFVTYKGMPKKVYSISYSIDGGDIVKKDLTEMYDGIYVHEFVLFFGQTVKYDILDEDENVLTNSILDCQSDIEDSDALRYNLINKMRNSYIYFDEKALLSDMKEINALSEETKALFHLEK